MYFMALATDYDGTLATDGAVDNATMAALQRLKDSGRHLILVTGREIPDLQRVFSGLDLCDLVVAENGAVLYHPEGGQEQPLGPPPPPAFVERLRQLGVAPLVVGRSIVATWHPNETLVIQAIRELGLELQVIFNKGAVMVLPANINKASGLASALQILGLSPLNVVGIGDAENDHAFLSSCGCAVAVANALPALKEGVDLVTAEARGAGVSQVIDQLLATDLGDVSSGFAGHQILVGRDDRDDGVSLSPHAGSVLVSGTSGGGKSTVVAGLLERFGEQGFQFCVVDPEGDYSEFQGAVVLGDASQAPRLEEALDLIRRPEISVVVNLLALDVADRPRFFADLLPALFRLRAETGRPHWIVVDEAHQMLPADRQNSSLTLPAELPAIVLVTVHPEELLPDIVRMVGNLVVIGNAPAEVLRKFCAVLGEPPPAAPEGDLPSGTALFWARAGGKPVRQIRVSGPKSQLKRHVRKYAEGELGEDKSFYFRGPSGALNLRAQNLSLFLQIGDGIDEETWLHHLRAGDYSRWFRDAIKDHDLADEAARVEGDDSLGAAASRSRIREMVTRRYTGPAGAA